MFFDNIEYEGHQLIWKSNFDEKSKLMKIGVTYSRMNDPEYEEELAKLFRSGGTLKQGAKIWMNL